MSTQQTQAILVEPTALVTIPFDRFMLLKNVEADKERYAIHIADHERNLSAANLKIKELETEAAKNPKVKELEEKLVEFQDAIITKDELIDLLNAKVKQLESKSSNDSNVAEKPKKAPPKKK